MALTLPLKVMVAMMIGACCMRLALMFVRVNNFVIAGSIQEFLRHHEGD